MSATEEWGDPWDSPAEPTNEVEYARLRRPDRTYITKSFPLGMPRSSPDYGQPTRYVRKVFDGADPNAEPLEGEEWTIPISPAGRIQLTVQVVREAGKIRRLYLERVPADGSANKLPRILELDRESAGKFIDVIRQLEHIPIEGENTVRLDDDLIREIFTDPDAASTLYSQNRREFRHAIENDVSARDVVALAYRRQELDRFRRMLNEPGYFTSERARISAETGKQIKPEDVWQRFLQANPWVLGIGLTGQLLTAWSGEKLEQTVAGFSVAGAGKRTDALMRTSGRIRSIVFTEIKQHTTPLLQDKPYRHPDCWAPSDELAGGVVQVQQTVAKAVHQIGERLEDKDSSGNILPGRYTYLMRPRSFLIIGRLDDLCGPDGGPNEDKFRSFEIFRRNTQEPEIMTFDELLARAEWQVETAERESLQEGAASNLDAESLAPADWHADAAWVGQDDPWAVARPAPTQYDDEPPF